jgi:hypothetical protein
MEREWFGRLPDLGADWGFLFLNCAFFLFILRLLPQVFFLIYLGMAFTLWVKDMFVTRRPNVFDL